MYSYVIIEINIKQNDNIMAYNLEWGRTTPGHMVYLIDISGSMSENNNIYNVLDCTLITLDILSSTNRFMKKYKEKFTISIYGYNSDVIKLFSGGVADIASLVKDAKNNNKPLFDISTKAKPQWQTFMAKAFLAAKLDIENWIKEQDSKGIPIPAPVVVNITDGYPYEGKNRAQEEVYLETLQAAEMLRNTTVDDGNTLLFNIHFDPQKCQREILLPENIDSTFNAEEIFLFEASSILPESYLKEAQNIRSTVHYGAKAMISNAKNKSLLTEFIKFGSSGGMNNNINIYK